MSKGIVMSAIIVIVVLFLFYFLIFRFTDLNPKYSEDNPIPMQIKEKLNIYYNKQLITSVTMESVGYGFEGIGSELNSSHSPTYLVTVKTEISGQEPCFYALMEDLTPLGIHHIVRYFIQKIDTFKGTTRITC